MHNFLGMQSHFTGYDACVCDIWRHVELLTGFTYTHAFMEGAGVEVGVDADGG